jgi:glutaredoxin
LNTQVLGISIDHVPCLKAWAHSLEGVTFPLLSDFWPHGKVAQDYGVLRAEGYSERAIFIIDGDGILRYIDIHDIADQPSNAVLFEELAKLAPGAFAQTVVSRDPDLPHGGVVMYCTQWCPDCKKARAWLKSHAIPYREVDIETNVKAARQVRDWAGGNQVTPTFDIDGKIVVDFDEDKLEEILLGKK